MYKCEKCGTVFEIPDFLKETHTQCPELPFEIFGVCPFCQCCRIERTDSHD